MEEFFDFLYAAVTSSGFWGMVGLSLFGLVVFAFYYWDLM